MIVASNYKNRFITRQFTVVGTKGMLQPISFIDCILSLHMSQDANSNNLIESQS